MNDYFKFGRVINLITKNINSFAFNIFLLEHNKKILVKKTIFLTIIVSPTSNIFFGLFKIFIQ